MSTADELFNRLDGQQVGSGPHARRIEIQGIREEGARYWVQMALLDGDSETVPLVINMTATATESDVLARVEQWLGNPDEADNRLIVID
ncbi:MAG TPA: hypothetical protein VFP91_05375 [Vicinamibacterales bacterium]|nr:hypothetical protein [Vicinamibacterales bacterium]